MGSKGESRRAFAVHSTAEGAPSALGAGSGRSVGIGRGGTHRARAKSRGRENRSAAQAYGKYPARQSSAREARGFSGGIILGRADGSATLVRRQAQSGRSDSVNRARDGLAAV